MAVTKLGIYNEALGLIGERPLTALGGTTETEAAITAVWDNGAVDYCLSLVRPKFAMLTAKSTTYVTDTDHGFNVYTLPADYLSIVGLYQDTTLDQPTERYFIEGRKLACSLTTIYLRYNANNAIAIPSGTDFSVLTPAFVRVLVAHLAAEISTIFSSDETAKIKGIFDTRVKEAIELEKTEEQPRNLASTGALAAGWLKIYNEALLLLGQDRLTSGSLDSWKRVAMDTCVASGAVDYCLSLVRPKFATLMAKLTVYTTDTDHGFNVFALPADYLSIVALYQDATLDRPTDRYFIEGRNLSCSYTTIYLRYNADNTIAIPSGTDFSKLTPSFSRLLAAYIAKEASSLFPIENTDNLYKIFDSRVKDAIALEQEIETTRSLARTGALSTEWLKIYNDALLILGQDRLSSGSEDSWRRVALDTSVDTGIVSSILEDIGWQFAMKTVKSDYNPSVDPDFGYAYAHDNPADMLIFDGVYTDEYQRSPLKAYQYEADVIYADHQELYIQYVSTDFVSAPATWPATFKRYVAAAIAKDCAGIFKADANRVELTWKQRKNDAKNLDASQSPPVVILPGSWTKSRFSGSDSRRDRNG